MLCQVLLCQVLLSGDAVSGVAVSGVAVSGVAVSGVAVSGVAVSGVAVSGVAVSGVAVSGVAVSGVAERLCLLPVLTQTLEEDSLGLLHDLLVELQVILLSPECALEGGLQGCILILLDLQPGAVTKHRL